MVKLMAALRRRPDMTSEQFHHYWRNVHGPIVLGVKDFMRHVRRYIQCHTLPSNVAFPSQTPPYDGVAELWFDSAEEAIKAFTEPKYLEIIRPDEPKFLDLAACNVFLTEESRMHG